MVIGGLGLNAKSSEAIEQLPPEVTLSFVPYADGPAGLDRSGPRQRRCGTVEAPMEPQDYPDNDPGPYTLLTTAKPADTVQRLDWLLFRATGYFGVTIWAPSS